MLIFVPKASVEELSVLRELFESFIAQCDDKLDYLKNLKDENPIKRKNTANDIKIVNTEKMLWITTLNFKDGVTSPDIYSLIVSKYDELINNSYDIARDMVDNEIVGENEYLEYCDNSLKKRNLVRRVAQPFSQMLVHSIEYLYELQTNYN